MKQFSATVVQQQDADVGAIVAIPERIHVVEETQVAYDEEVELLIHRGIAQSRRERAVYAIEAPIAQHLYIFRHVVELGVAHSRAVGQMQGTGRRQVLQQLAHGCHLRVGQLWCLDARSYLFPRARVGRRHILYQWSYLLQKLEGIHLYDGGQSPLVEVAHLAVTTDVPMFQRRIVAQEILQSARDDVSAIGDEQLRAHVGHGVLRHRVEHLVNMAEWGARHRLVAYALRDPDELFRQLLHILLVEEVDQAHLASYHHAVAIAVQSLYQGLVVVVIHIQTLVATYHALSRQLSRAHVEERLCDRHIDVNRPPAVVRHLHQSLIDQSVAIPSLLLRVHIRQADALLHQPTEHPRLRHRLSVHLSYPSRWSVCRDDDQRHLLVVSLCHSRMEVEQRAAAGAYHRHRLSAMKRQSHGIESRTALIRHRVAFVEARANQRLRQRYVPAARAEHYLTDAMLT